MGGHHAGGGARPKPAAARPPPPPTVLSPAILAQIFSSQIVVWDDPAIVALNPGQGPPPRPIHRSIPSLWRNCGGEQLEPSQRGRVEWA